MIFCILKQTFLFLDKKTFLLLYISLIRPHLEYVDVIWYPKYKYQSISVKRVQRRATKLLMETRHMTHSRVGILRVAFLMVWKTRGVMIQVLKIINGIDDMNCFFSEVFFNLLIMMVP